MENINEQVQQEPIKMEVMREQLSKCEVIGDVITVGVLGSGLELESLQALRWLMVWKSL